MISDKQIQKALREVASGKKPIELKDPGERGAGRLAIVVRPMATRVAAEWYAVFYRNGKRTTAKLGSYPTISVSEARRKFLTEFAPAISAGESPSVARHQKAARNGTVSELFSAYVDHLARAGKRVAPMVRGYLLAEKGGAARAIGADRPATVITPDDIVPHLAAIHRRGSQVHANTVRAYLSAAFNFGLKAEHDFTRANIDARWGLTSNPVAAIPADASAKRVGNRFLTPAEFREVWLWLDSYRKDSLIACAVMIKMATGQRSEEVLRISVVSYDREKVMLYWAETKNGTAHSIPLPHQAAAILDATTPNSHGWFFPHQYDSERCANHASMMNVIERFRRDHDMPAFTPRDLRRTWKTLAGDAGLPKEMRDRLQNHSRGDVSSRHYDRYDYLPERRAATAKWAAYLDLVIVGKVDQLGGRADNVVQIGKGAAA